MKTERDMEILRLVKQFQQLTSAQINELLFNDVTDTPCDRALKRLVETRHLVRVGRLLIRGLQGGSGMYVYSLGRAAWPLFYTGRYKVRGTVYPHMLDIVDAYVALVREERAGRLSLVKVKTEPATSLTVGQQLLKPDLYVRVQVPGKGQASLWVEVDRDTEHRGQMAAMFERYRQAFLNFDDELRVFPFIVVLVSSEWREHSERVKELTKLIASIPEAEVRALFKVELLSDFPKSWTI